MLPPKDRVPAPDYREMPLTSDVYLAILVVRGLPEWWREPETVIVLKCTDADEALSAALVRDVF